MKIEIIQRITNIALPQNREKYSVVKLIENTGYNASKEQILANDLAAYLQDKPKLIEAWRNWSEDKRTSSGWYFIQDGRDYIVGFYPDGNRLQFSDPAQACAEFILHELSVLR